MAQIDFYKPNNSNYTKNGDVTLTPTSAIFTVAINETWEVEITQPYDKEGRWKLLCEDGIIKCDIPEHDGGELFYVYDIDKNLDGVTLKARQIFYQEINTVILDRRSVNVLGQSALENVLLGTLFTAHSNILKTNTCYFVKTNVVEAINGTDDNTFINRWGGEIWHDKYDLYINEKIGQDRGIRIEYGKNLINVDLHVNLESVVTRIYPYAEDDIRLPESYINSSNINKYRKSPLSKFVDMTDMKLHEEGQDDDGYATLDDLYTAMRKRVQQLYDDGIDLPTVDGTVEIACLENTEDYKFIKNLVKVRLGDDITVYHRDLDINMKARCTGYTYNLLTNKFESVTIGQVEADFFEQQSDMTNRIDRTVKKAIDREGNVLAEKVRGEINAINAQLVASKNISKKMDYRAFQLLDNEKSSPTYGSVIGSSTGIYCASTKDSQGNWKYEHAITGKGILGELIYAGHIYSQNGKVDFNLNNAVIKFIQNDGGYMLMDENGIRRYALNNSNCQSYYRNERRYYTITTDANGDFSFTAQFDDWFKGLDWWWSFAIPMDIRPVDSNIVYYIPGRFYFGTSAEDKNGRCKVEGKIMNFGVTGSFLSDGNQYVLTNGKQVKMSIQFCVIAIS